MEDNRNDEEFQNYRKFFHAVYSGNLVFVKEFLQSHPDATKKLDSLTGVPALQLAVSAKNVEMVEELVQLMPEKDLEIIGGNGDTALTAAAVVGIKSMAKCMVEKRNNLVNIANGENLIPVSIAVLNNHKDMARYLYSVTRLEDLEKHQGKQGATLIVACIQMRHYGTFLKISKVSKFIFLNFGMHIYILIN